MKIAQLLRIHYRKKYRVVLVLFFFYGLWCVCIGSRIMCDPIITVAFAQDNVQKSVAINASVSTDMIRVGEDLAYVLEIEWNGDEDAYKVVPPTLQLTGLSLNDVGISSEKSSVGGRDIQKKVFHYSLRAMEPGAATIGVVHVDYLQKGTATPFVETLPAFTIAVKRPQSTMSLFVLLGSVSMSIFCLLGISFYLLKRARRKEESQRADTVSLEDHTLAELSALKLQIHDGEHNAFLTHLYTIAERYLRQKYAIAESADLEVALAQHDLLLRDDKRKLADILKIAREARYSGFSYDDTTVQQLFQTFSDFVQGKKII